jgi:hypothetical protein
MSKYIKISQTTQTAPQPASATEKQPVSSGVSNSDKAIAQKIKGAAGNMSVAKLMADLNKISKSSGDEKQKEAQALKYLQSISSQLSPLTQALNNIGVKIPR